MVADDGLFDFLDDLEAQAESLYAQQRASEVADRSRAEYRHVTLTSRLVATLDQGFDAGPELALSLSNGQHVAGELTRVGADWCQLRVGEKDWVVLIAAIESASGLASRSTPEIAWSPLTKLGVPSVLRGSAESGQACALHLRSGAVLRGRIGRVGADFCEVSDGGTQRVVPIGNLVAITR